MDDKTKDDLFDEDGHFLETETRRLAEKFAPVSAPRAVAVEGVRAIEQALRQPEPDRPRLFLSSLTAREKSHGNFDNAAAIAQRLKTAMRDTPSWEVRLDAMHQEALEGIATSLAGILAGDPKHREHWTNIAVFARLIEERLV